MWYTKCFMQIQVGHVSAIVTWSAQADLKYFNLLDLFILIVSNFTILLEHLNWRRLNKFDRHIHGLDCKFLFIKYKILIAYFLFNSKK